MLYPMIVYILYSQTIGQYYTGHTQDLDLRIKQHNTGKGAHTSKGILWSLVWFVECETRSLAMQLEKKIKKRGAKRFLEDLEG